MFRANNLRYDSKLKPRPTFKQFINYVLSLNVADMNDHWRPQWLHAHICHLRFDLSGGY